MFFFNIIFILPLDWAAKCVQNGAKDIRPVLLQLLRTFPHNTTPCFCFLTQEPTPQRRRYLSYMCHWGQRRLTFKWGHGVRAKASCESPGLWCWGCRVQICARASERLRGKRCAAKGQESAHVPPSEGGDEKRGELGAGCGWVAYK